MLEFCGKQRVHKHTMIRETAYYIREEWGFTPYEPRPSGELKYKDVNSFRVVELLTTSQVGELCVKASRTCSLMPSGCVESTAAPSAKRPHVWDCSAGVKHNFQITHLFLYQAGIWPAHWYDEVSHHCHNSRCVNINHVAWEHPALNIDRDLCFQRMQNCHHEPPCLAFKE